MLDTGSGKYGSYPKIGEEHFASRIKKDILWFKVTMHDILLMGMMQGLTYLCQDNLYLIPGEPTLLVQPLTSICGLGQAAPNPILSVIKYFKDDIIRYITP